MSNLLEVNATTYTATFTAAANTDIDKAVVSVNVNSWQEVKGNPGMGATSSAFKVDTVTPAVAVSINNSDVNLAYDTATAPVARSLCESPRWTSTFSARR